MCDYVWGVSWDIGAIVHAPHSESNGMSQSIKYVDAKGLGGSGVLLNKPGRYITFEFRILISYVGCSECRITMS